jgi:transcriptional regulator with XRE-family HTH domain
MGSGIAQSSARLSTVSDRQQSVPHVEGAPTQRSFRGVLRREHEEEGDHLREALDADLDSTRLSDEEIEERTGVARAQLSRIRNGQAHAPWPLVVWAVDNSRLQPPAIVVAMCGVAEGEFRPKPPPSVEERHAATLDVLHEMGISEVVVGRVARKLGVTR